MRDATWRRLRIWEGGDAFITSLINLYGNVSIDIHVPRGGRVRSSAWGVLELVCLTANPTLGTVMITPPAAGRGVRTSDEASLNEQGKGGDGDHCCDYHGCCYTKPGMIYTKRVKRSFGSDNLPPACCHSHHRCQD